MAEIHYLVGIDLGTSNCAVAFTEPERGPEAPIVDFPVPQLHRPGELATLPLLPSCLYLAAEEELPRGATRLPWDDPGPVLIGESARWQGSRVPGRLVSSAKSWLCHPGVDRSAPILPWGAPDQVAKVSPVDASTRLLAHIVQAWNHAHPQALLQDQEVVITVPASFDEVARALTATAAARAGLQKFTLLEEPQAAFYDFISRHRRDLEQALAGVRLVLVVDVGGGTSDFTLVQAAAGADGLSLRRIAVGEHLMLGGDNMDAALARTAESRMQRGEARLSTSQWNQLLQATRAAKEALLAHPAEGAGTYNLSIASEGSRLLGRSLSTHLTKLEAEHIVLEGFLPFCAPDARPQSSARTGFQELGLPYAHDPGITRHLAAFLQAHSQAAFSALEQPPVSTLPRPDAVLLNGGVFNSPGISRRLIEAVSAWWPGRPDVPLLHHESLDLAVARGAAYYGLVRHGLGKRIGGGAAHALYLGLEKPGAENPVVLCVVPRGHEEGQPLDLGERVFQLAVEKPVRFPLFSTAGDRFDKPGDVVPLGEDLQPLPPIHTLLKSSQKQAASVPVHLSANLTEIGTLELWCVSNQTPERWRLEFELRGSAPDGRFAVTAAMPSGFAHARVCIEHIYGTRRGATHSKSHAAQGKSVLPRDVKQLWMALEQTLGAREDWGLAVLRELWSALFAAAAKRRRSAEHERVFFQLLGFCLRPGFGYPLDEWRCEESARMFAESVQFHQEKAVWNEFWVLWRRLSGGLNEARHQELWAYLKPYLAARVPPGAKTAVRPKGIQPDGLDEMARLAASLEHLDPVEKAVLGNWISLRLQQPSTASGPWTWALGRIGARVPIYGSVHKTVPVDTVTAWIVQLLERDAARLEGSLFALVQMTRLTGDRHRDIAADLRGQVLERLKAPNASPSWERVVAMIVPLEAADRARALGDTLPVGLKLA